MLYQNTFNVDVFNIVRLMKMYFAIAKCGVDENGSTGSIKYEMKVWMEAIEEVNNCFQTLFIDNTALAFTY